MRSRPTLHFNGNGMSIELPLYEQERPKTCALACLRMILAAFGTEVEESAIEAEARMIPGGTEIGELERLARLFGLVADIEEVPVEQLPAHFAEGRLVMIYLDRAVFDLNPDQRRHHTLRNANIHVVVPTRVGSRSVTYNDPLSGRSVRRSIRLFRSAYERLGNRCVVCSKPLE